MKIAFSHFATKDDPFTPATPNDPNVCIMFHEKDKYSQFVQNKLARHDPATGEWDLLTRTIEKTKHIHEGKEIDGTKWKEETEKFNPTIISDLNKQLEEFISTL